MPITCFYPVFIGPFKERKTTERLTLIDNDHDISCHSAARGMEEGGNGETIWRNDR